jgi:hypothetical protein
MDKKMMICTKKDGFCDRTCSFALPHEYIEGCEVFEGKLEGCPACIEYVEPSSPAQRSVNGCIKKTPEEIKQDCEKCDYWEGFCTVKECIKAPQPEPSMPLICADCGVEDAGICEGHECAGRQRDADMKVLEAKVQQVRKDLLDEIEQKYKILLSHRHNKKTTEFYIHINPDKWQEFRAMAEGVGSVKEK